MRGRPRLPDGEAAFRQLLKSYRRHAKIRNYKFSISGYDFRLLTRGSCYYCGIEPQQVYKSPSGATYIYNGVDRVDSTIGYEAGNVVSCCGICNIAKGQMTSNQFVSWIERVHLYQQKLKEVDQSTLDNDLKVPLED